MVESELAAQLLAAVAGGAALVAGLTAAIKALAFPDTWQHGRAPMVLAALLALGVVLAAAASLGVQLAAPGALVALATAWLTVYTAAIGTHQTVTKAGRIASATTNPTGPDDAPDAAPRG